MLFDIKIYVEGMHVFKYNWKERKLFSSFNTLR